MLRELEPALRAKAARFAGACTPDLEVDDLIQVGRIQLAKVAGRAPTDPEYRVRWAVRVAGNAMRDELREARVRRGQYRGQSQAVTFDMSRFEAVEHDDDPKNQRIDPRTIGRDDAHALTLARQFGRDVAKLPEKTRRALELVLAGSSPCRAAAVLGVSKSRMSQHLGAIAKCAAKHTEGAC